MTPQEVNLITKRLFDINSQVWKLSDDDNKKIIIKLIEDLIKDVEQ